MDLAALIVACLGFLVAAIALGWQIGTWFLDGPRARAVLLHGIAGRGGVLVADVESNGRPHDLQPYVDQGWNGAEVLGVRVINPGRTRLQVASISVQDVEGKMGLTKPRGNALSPSLPCWVEPGTQETWYVEAEDARMLAATAASVADRRPGPLRMVVELGTGRKVRTNRVIRF